MQQFLRGKIFMAGLLISIILVSSAIFLSQADKLFGKAQTAAITGVIVLYDKDPSQSSYVQAKSFDPILYLPNENCVGTVNYCFGNKDIASSTCTSAALTHMSGRRYAAQLSEQVVRELSCSRTCGPSCGSTPDSASITGTDMLNVVASTTCSAWSSAGSWWSSSSASVTKSGSTIFSLSSSCGGSDPKAGAMPNVQAPFTISINCNADHNGGTGGSSSEAKIKVSRGPNAPVSHISVSYECPA